MIDSNHMTDVFFDEAHLLAESIAFSDAPHLTPDEKYQRAVEQSPLPARDAVVAAIEEVFWASLLTEEGRPCRPRLSYDPKREPNGKQVHWLERPEPLARDRLRKLTPVQGPLGYLTWDDVSGKPEITGVQRHFGAGPDGLIIGSPNCGALDMSWSSHRVIALRAGRINRMSTASRLGMVPALTLVQRLLGGFPPIFLADTVQAIANEGHGGAVWILRRDSSYEGIHVGFAVRPDETPLPAHHEVRSNWLQSVGYLAMVDGAVLLDSDLRVLGFGAFIEVPEPAKDVTCIHGPDSVQIRPSNQLGGGRHRSGVEFCARFAPAAAVIVSEDGRISIIWSEAPDRLFLSPIAILGVNLGLIRSH